MKLGIGNVVAVIGFVAFGIAAGAGAQGCTASLTIGSCDGGNCGNGNGNGNGNGDDNTDSGDNVPVDDASIFADTGSTPFDACNSCLYGQCVGAYSNCVANASCLGIYQCATSTACTADGGNCVQDCFDAGDATGKALYLALGDCDQAAECPNPGALCASVCNPAAATCTISPDDAGGTDAATGEDAGPQTCSQCQASLCASQLAACATGTACATYNQCVLGCTDSTCLTACQTTNPSGYSAAQSFGSCTTTSCATPCSTN